MIYFLQNSNSTDTKCKFVYLWCGLFTGFLWSRIERFSFQETTKVFLMSAFDITNFFFFFCTDRNENNVNQYKSNMQEDFFFDTCNEFSFVLMLFVMDIFGYYCWTIIVFFFFFQKNFKVFCILLWELSQLYFCLSPVWIRAMYSHRNGLDIWGQWWRWGI